MPRIENELRSLPNLSPSEHLQTAIMAEVGRPSVRYAAHRHRVQKFVSHIINATTLSIRRLPARIAGHSTGTA